MLTADVKQQLALFAGRFTAKREEATAHQATGRGGISHHANNRDHGVWWTERVSEGCKRGCVHGKASSRRWYNKCQRAEEKKERNLMRCIIKSLLTASPPRKQAEWRKTAPRRRRRGSRTATARFSAKQAHGEGRGCLQIRVQRAAAATIHPLGGR